jgi:hypothetical protein
MEHKMSKEKRVRIVHEMKGRHMGEKHKTAKHHEEKMLHHKEMMEHHREKMKEAKGMSAHKASRTGRSMKD